MDVASSDRTLIEQVTAAMQAGDAGKEAMIALFADDATLIDSFSGQQQTSAGKDAVRARYYAMVAEPRPPDFLLKLDRLDTDGKQVIANWSCTSSVFPGPMLGVSHYTIRDGKIQRLEIKITRMPGQP